MELKGDYSPPERLQGDFDVLIIGAGLSGICSLYHIRKRFPSWKIKVLEAGPDSGGVWLWNCYPGARVDTESITYCYSWDEELLETWRWSDTFASQPEVLKYIQLVTRKHKLYENIQFNVRIRSASWQEESCSWSLVDETGNEYKTTFLVSCLGFLSKPTLPRIPGIGSFKGQSFHTANWPKDFELTRDFAGKRIGVIGTGATGIQTITAISKEPSIKSLHVFQRTANWSAPLRNRSITDEEMDHVRQNYQELFKHCSETPSCFMHQADPRKAVQLDEQARIDLYEKLYSEPGFGKWLGVFSDTYSNRESNNYYSEFMAEKIRARVHDPIIADRLIPKSHGYGTRRVPLESGYFEAYNQPHVHLVDLTETPILKIKDAGIETSDARTYELDVIIYATGFDAITGAYNDIEWHAKDDRPLIAQASAPGSSGKHAVWPDHQPKTFLGITAPAVPNMFMVLGPHQPFGNAPRSIEHVVDVVCDMLQFCKEKEYTYIEASQKAADEWTEHVFACSNGSLINDTDSWMTGVNRNVAGKTVRTVARYAGHQAEYRRRCAATKAAGYEGLVFK